MSGMTEAELFGQQPVAAPKAAAPAIAPLPAESDDYLIARAAMAEGDPTPESWRNVGGVVRNRMANGGKSAATVLSEPRQFETYSNGRLQGVDTASPQFQAALKAVQGVKAGDVPYDAFYSPSIVAARGHRTPPFDPSTGKQIGTQLFGNLAPSDLTADEEAKWAALQAPAAASPEGDKPGSGAALVEGQKVTAAQEATIAKWAKAGRHLSGVPGTAELPYFVKPGGVLPATPGAHWVDLDGAEHVVAGGVEGLANSAVQGLGQGLGPDVLHSALKLTEGGLATAGVPFSAAPQGPDSDQQMREGALAAAARQAHDYSAAHMGDEAAQGGRFVGQAIPATAAAAAVPEVELPGAAATNALGMVSRVGGRTATNALRGVAGVAPTVGATDAPVGEQLGVGALAGATLAPALNTLGKTGQAVTGTVRGILEPLTERGRGQIADRMIRARAAGSNITNPDLTEYIPGSRPTTAEALGNTGLAIAQRSMTNTPAFTELGRSNSEARDAVVAALKGDSARRETLVATRDAEAMPLLQEAFAHPRPVNPAPVVARIDEILAGPAGERNAVRQVLGDIRRKIVNSVEQPPPPALAGMRSVSPAAARAMASAEPVERLETDPAQLYGIRQAIGDALSARGTGTESDARLATRELLAVRDALDPVIETGAPGFKNYLSRFAELSQPINEHDFLQSLNLTTPKGQVTAGQVGSALKTVDKLQRANGVNGAKALSDETLQTLRNLQADLKRQGNNELGRGQGSDTMQKGIENAMSGSVSMHPLLAASAAGVGLTHNPLFGAIAGVGLLKRGVLEAERGNISRAYADRLIDPTLGLPALQEPRGNAVTHALSGFSKLARPTQVPLSALGADWLVNRGYAVPATVGSNSQ